MLPLANRTFEVEHFFISSPRPRLPVFSSPATSVRSMNGHSIITTKKQRNEDAESLRKAKKLSAQIASRKLFPYKTPL